MTSNSSSWETEGWKLLLWPTCHLLGTAFLLHLYAAVLNHFSY